jgi:Zn-dependent protease with chaperone function
MEFHARYQDGLVGAVRAVLCTVDPAAAPEPATLSIRDPETREVIDGWRVDRLFARHARPTELRLGTTDRPAGARVAIVGVADIRTATSLLPDLKRGRQREENGEAGTVVLATGALLAVIFAYLYGIPLIADRLVVLVPPSMETRVGATAAAQIEDSLTGGKGYAVCDPDPQSIANRAIDRFVKATFDGLHSPFTPHVTVVRSTIPNAFALPGGQAYYLSELLAASETPDEFAGVLAHEFGHVYYRHGMTSLIASSTTGLLVGFILGDMTGISVAAAIGSALIATRFSREAEAQADAFAAATARRLHFGITGLADLLDRVSKDDDFSKALALFATHPLTAERRAALAAMAAMASTDPDTQPYFTADEWTAIKSMCPPLPPPPLPPMSTPAQ